MEMKHEDNFINLYDGEKLAGHIEYVVMENNVIDVIHTIVSEDYQGQGIAGKLFKELVTYVKTNNLKMIPTCSYIKHQIDKNPELNELTVNQ